MFRIIIVGFVGFVGLVGLVGLVGFLASRFFKYTPLEMQSNLTLGNVLSYSYEAMGLS